MRSMLIALGDRRVALRDDEEKQKGFTLIELLVVVIIIGILAAIAIPIFLSQREGAWRASVESDVKNATLAIETYATANNGSPAGAGGSSSDGGAYSTAGVDFRASSHNTVIVTVAGNTYTIKGSNSDLGAQTLDYNSETGLSKWSDRP